MGFDFPVHGSQGVLKGMTDLTTRRKQPAAGAADSHQDQGEEPEAIKEITVLWITAGLGCDGDTIAMTAATQPSIEDIVLCAIPGIPKVHFYNPVLAYENGDEFMRFFYLELKLLFDIVGATGDRREVAGIERRAFRRRIEKAG
jgi:hypothetical protein